MSSPPPSAWPCSDRSPAGWWGVGDRGSRSPSASRSWPRCPGGVRPTRSPDELAKDKRSGAGEYGAALQKLAAEGYGDLAKTLAAQGDDTRVQPVLVREAGRGEDFFRSVVIEALGDYKAKYRVIYRA